MIIDKEPRTLFRTAACAVALLLVCGLAGAADAPSDAGSGPIGSWQVMKREAAGATFEVVMTIAADSITMTSKCQHQNDTIEVAVSSPAEVTADQLRILQSDSDDQPFGAAAFNCSARIAEATLGYEMDDGKLVIFDFKKPEPLVFSRVKL